MPNDVQENRITRLLNTDQNGTLYTSFWLQIFKTDLKMITSVKVLTNSPQPFGMQHQGFSTVRDCNWDRIGCICRDINKHDKMATWPRPMFKTLQPTKWTIFGSLAHSLHQCDRWKLPFTFSQFFREVFQLPALSIRILNLLQLLKSISATNNITPIRKQQRRNGTWKRNEWEEEGEDSDDRARKLSAMCPSISARSSLIADNWSMFSRRDLRRRGCLDDTEECGLDFALVPNSALLLLLLRHLVWVRRIFFLHSYLRGTNQKHWVVFSSSLLFPRFVIRDSWFVIF